MRRGRVFGYKVNWRIRSFRKDISIRLVTLGGDSIRIVWQLLLHGFMDSQYGYFDCANPGDVTSDLSFQRILYQMVGGGLPVLHYTFSVIPILSTESPTVVTAFRDSEIL
jgi:hypothetical protein